MPSQIRADREPHGILSHYLPLYLLSDVLQESIAHLTNFLVVFRPKLLYQKLTHRLQSAGFLRTYFGKLTSVYLVFLLPNLPLLPKPSHVHLLIMSLLAQSPGHSRSVAISL